MSKTPFLVADGFLLLGALLLAVLSPGGPGAAEIAGIVACLGLGGVLMVIPFLIEHSRRQVTEAEARRRETVAIEMRTADAATKLNDALANVQRMAETSARVLPLLEAWPQAMQDQVRDISTQFAGRIRAETAAVERSLETARASLETACSSLTSAQEAAQSSLEARAIASDDRARAALADMARVEEALRGQMAAAQTSVATLQERTDAAQARVEAAIDRAVHALPAIGEQAGASLAAQAEAIQAALRDAGAEIEKRIAGTEQATDERTQAAVAALDAQVERLLARWEERIETAAERMVTRVGALETAAEALQERARELAETPVKIELPPMPVFAPVAAPVAEVPAPVVEPVVQPVEAVVAPAPEPEPILEPEPVAQPEPEPVTEPEPAMEAVEATPAPVFIEPTPAPIIQPAVQPAAPVKPPVAVTPPVVEAAYGFSPDEIPADPFGALGAAMDSAIQTGGPAPKRGGPARKG